jgi:hypothetical protein
MKAYLWSWVFVTLLSLTSGFLVAKGLEQDQYNPLVVFVPPIACLALIATLVVIGYSYIPKVILTTDSNDEENESDAKVENEDGKGHWEVTKESNQKMQPARVRYVPKPRSAGTGMLPPGTGGQRIMPNVKPIEVKEAGEEGTIPQPRG